MDGRLLTMTILCVWASVTACSSPPPVPRAALVPPLAIDAPAADLSRHVGQRADADHSPPLPSSEFDAGEMPPTSQPPVYRTVVHTVETPVYVDRSPRDNAADWTPYSDANRAYYVRGDDRHYGRRWRESPFPINTAIGVGIGAAIGNQHRHRGRGALVGGTIGLLFDLQRWWR